MARLPMSTTSLKALRMFSEVPSLIVLRADWGSVTFDDDCASTLEANPLVSNVEVDSEVHTQ